MLFKPQIELHPETLLLSHALLLLLSILGWVMRQSYGIEYPRLPRPQAWVEAQGIDRRRSMSFNKFLPPC